MYLGNSTHARKQRTNQLLTVTDVIITADSNNNLKMQGSTEVLTLSNLRGSLAQFQNKEQHFIILAVSNILSLVPEYSTLLHCRTHDATYTLLTKSFETRDIQ